MRRTILSRAAALGAGLLVVVVGASPASAALIWDGDASHGPGVLGGTGGDGNCGTGRITAVSEAGRGQVWRFHKPRSSNRCEVHGVKVGGSVYRFQENATYYLGWSSRLTDTVNNNATFQWKSYGSHQVNFPLWMKMVDGRLVLFQRQLGPRESRIWSTPLRAGAWNHFVLGIHTSRADRGGWVELYFNGVQQTFSNGTRRFACRTWDAPGYNDPKWGIYGARNREVNNFVDDLKIGTTYADVR